MVNLSTLLTESDVQKSLDIARQLIKAGVPVFAAPPCNPQCGLSEHPVGVPHFALPKHWTKTVPTEMWVDRWEPGWALAAIGGHAADFLDVDPRSGGDGTAAEMIAAGEWPRTFGRQATPSGGYHDLISATRERKIVLARGVDLQAGAPDGTGRGFVYLAPTIAASKVTGEMVAYRWTQEPDLGQLLEWQGRGGEVVDDSLQYVISRVQARRSQTAPLQRLPLMIDPADPFLTASTVPSAGERSFTLAQAQDFVRPALLALQSAQVGEIEERANTAAATLSHFVPSFWTVDEAYAFLTTALGQTAYDPDRPGTTWTAEKFRRVLDGSRPSLDPWRATRAVEFDPTLFNPDAAPLTLPMPASPEEASSLVDRLLAEMLTMDQMIKRPPPKPLIMGLLDLDSEAWIIGAPGCRKSFVALDFARCVATGTPWQGRKVAQGLVIYVVAEGATGMSLRGRALTETYGQIDSNLLILPRPVQAIDPVAWNVLVEACRRLKPSLVILDTQARVTVGLEENNSTGIGVYVEAVRKIREATEACVLTVHHTGRRGEDARGSNAIDGAQGSELRVKVDGEASALRGYLMVDKQKDMAEAEGGIPLRFRVVDLGVDEETERPLSSLVLVEADAFDAAEGSELDVTRPWLPAFHHRDQWKRTILNAFHDFAHEGTGLTKPEVKAILVRDAGLSTKSNAFDAAWKVVLDLTDPDGAPVVGKVGGERYDVVSLAVRHALREERGAGGTSGQG